MEQDKRQFYRDILEKNERDIKTVKISRNSNSYMNNNCINSSNTQSNFKNKFFIQILIVLSIIGIFYMLTRNNSMLSKNILDKTKSILDKNINIENLAQDFGKIKKEFTFNPKVILGNENKVYIDENELDKMKEDLEIPSKN